MGKIKGSKMIAETLHDLGVKVIFGLPGLPVIDIADQSIALGIRFISFRNEQAACYAASAYGYLTGKPGVCLCVGGPGVFHVMAGIPHAVANSWPVLILAGASETHNANKMAFQEVDQVTLLAPMAKLAMRPPHPHMTPAFIRDAYRSAFFGRPGPTYIDLPADIILGHFDVDMKKLGPLNESPLPAAPDHKIKEAVQALKNAKAPLVVLGKGAAYARAEKQIRNLVEKTGLPFLPSPMGKGVVPDSSPNNASSARSTALKEADVVLVLGGKLNWILGFGLPPKWNASVNIIQVDVAADELGKNGGNPSMGLVGDVGLVVDQIISQLGNWKWDSKSSSFSKNIQAAKSKNEKKAAEKAAVDKIPMTFEKSFDVIKKTLDSISNPQDGDIVYVSEGANAMDISRSIFTMEHPRIKLDAGTYATMGVGMGYSIAAHAAYNFPQPQGLAGTQSRKKIVAIEGDSAFGMSAMEVETMARFGMDVMVYVMNNSGLYQGDTDTGEKWQERQKVTIAGDTVKNRGLTAMSLGWETNYEKIAEMCGGLGIVARTPDELKKATEQGYKSKVPTVINVILDTDSDKPMDFSWLDMAPPDQQKHSKL